jgi:peptide/nickel transport system permease protein
MTNGGRNSIMNRAKILTYLAAFLLIIILNFLLPRLMPGDPFLAIYGEEAALTLSEETKLELIAALNLDKPLWQQFGSYLAHLMRGDLGYSYGFNAPVLALIGRVLPWTILLIGSSLVISTLIGIVLGIESGWRLGSRWDRFILLTAMSLSALPNFLIGSILLLFFAVHLAWFPLGGAFTPYSGLSGFGFLADVLKHLFLPMLTLALTQLTDIILLTRAAMVGSVKAPYILTAKAKGLKDFRVRYRHAGRNSLLPVSARLGVAVGSSFAGTLFIEIVFAYPGIGSLLHQAIINRDYPLLQGILLVVACAIIMANWGADCFAQRIDPRTRKEQHFD